MSELLTKINSFIRNNLFYLYVIVIAVAIMVGITLPQAVKSLSVLFLPLFFLMVYPMMIRTRVERIADIARMPRIILSSMVFQVIVAPIFGVVLAKIFVPNDPYLFAGVILTVIVPACAMLPGWVGLGNGNILLGVALLAVGFIVAIGAVPLLSWVLLPKVIALSPVFMFKKICIVVIVPLVAGFLTRISLTKFAGKEAYGRVELVLPLLTAIGLFGVIFCAMSIQAGFIVQYPAVIGKIVILWIIYYGAMILLLFPVTRKLVSSYQDGVAFFYGGYLKNFTITAGLAVLMFNETTVLIPLVAAMFVQTPGATLVLRNLERIVGFKEAVATG
jgi:ACR3 family arsenite efflux pump ArsB